MRRLCYQVAASLDGFIAGPDGEYDWIPEDPSIDFDAIVARFDSVVMGRHTYEVAGANGGLRWLGDREIVVFSRTLVPAEHPGVTIVSDGALEFVRGMKIRQGLDIWLFGGGRTFAALLGADLVDTVEIAVMPILLGVGLPLLPADLRRTLRLTRTREYPSGILLTEYEVEPR